eukprot:XP_014028414.1 PREDICTED: collagen alpha-3(VI) chain-like [Salmo salar]
MRKHRMLPLCALLGVLFAGLLPKLDAQEEAQESADLVFLIDGSENVGAANFPRVRDLAMKVIEGLDVGRDTIRVAVALYSADPEVQFFLNTYENKAAVLDAVKTIQFTGSKEANLGAALEKVAESLLSPPSGGRAEEGVPQALVVISAGPSNDDFSAGDRALKAANVITFGVVVGGMATAELETIATDKSFVLSAPDFRAVASMGDQLLPYVNGVTQGTIVVQNEFTEALEVGKRDIIFLIDSTMGATTINSLREFIKRFVDTMPIGPDQVQVGVAQFSNAARLEIDLNAYGSKEDLNAALGRLKPRPGQVVNIGVALDFVRTNMLRADKGSRIQQGVPQLVLLMTSKKSSDSVGQAAEALQRMGVLTLAAGSKTADEQELKQIAFDESLVFMLNDFRILLRNPGMIVSLLSTLSGVVVTEGPTEPVVEITTVQTQRVVRDIVFMVDGSSYIGGANLPYVRDFIVGVVNLLDVRPDRVRIGLMQFAENPKIEFYLNTHNTKQDVLAKVGQLRLMGGSALNTGAAMDYALTNMFQASTGSRQRQGVQQVLLLITGGPSQDEVKKIADKVAVAGVLTFTVSAGQADEAYLKTVAFVPNLAYHESRFSSLPSVVEQIMTPLITVVGDTDISVTDIEITKEPAVVRGERDVAFLIDGSDNVRADFPYIRDFIIKVIEPLDIGQDRVRISVVQHSERPAPNFYLNTYKNKAEVLRAVNDLRLAGGRNLNTGMALKFMKDTILSPVHGSRAAQNVPQFLIVLTAGKSKDSVKESAGALKTNGVVPFAVGVKDADPKQIEAISHNPSFAFNVKEFSQLNMVQQRLNSYVSLPKEELKVILDQASVHAISVHTDAVKRDIVFLLDGSDGTRSGFPAVRDFIQSIVGKLSVEENRDRVSVVQYADKPEAHFYLNSHKTKDAIINAVSKMRHKGGRSLNTGAALQFVRHRVFTASSGSRRLEGVPQILILLTSKKSRDDVKGPAVALKDLEIVSLGVGVGDANVRELEIISFQPGFTYQVTEFSELPTIQPQLVATLKRLSKDTEESVAPVTPGIPDLVVESQAPRRDVVFLLDGSDGTRSGFPAMRDFVQRVVETLGVDENRDRVAVVQYSKDPAAQFYLNTYTTKGEILNTVRGLRHKGGRPLNTGAALQYVRDNVFIASSGSRRLEGVPQILILLNGGRSFDNVDTPASALKELGVLVFGIGTRSSDSRELQKISYDPSYALSVSEFTDLPNVQQQLFSAMSTVIVQVTTMTPTVIPTILVESQAPMRDVVFLLDGSDGTRSGFPAMRDFVQRVVETLGVDENRDRVAVVQYSKDPAAQFYLNTYTTKGEILNTVRGLRHKGGRPLNTGAALQYVRDNVFTVSSGSRRIEGVPQLLILLSGGRSFDNVDTPASALKELGVLIFGIGTRSSDSRELQRISHDPSYALSVSDFTDLPNIQQQLLSSVEAVVIEVTPESTTDLVDHDTSRKDVVFLVDGSDGTRNGFPAMRDFVQRVVGKLNVGGDKDRVSVVQYGRDQEVHFYLNTYTTKEDILDTVRSLRHRGGRPLNTGAALQYVRDNVFTASSGSRSQEGVPQMLILLSGGRSSDNVDIPASALKESGVLIFGIGTRNSSREVQRIATDPSFSQSVSEFTDLPSIQEQFFSSLITVQVEATPITPPVIVDQSIARKDVVFLLDGSDGTSNGFPAMRDFVQRVVEKLTVEENRDRVSVVQYSRESEAHFYLNTYTTKEDVVDTVRGLRHKGGRPLNTGAALQYVRDNVFIASSGSRRLEGVPQILILLNGGRSFDNVDTPASALKELGVLVFGIGTRSSDSRELQKISYDPSYALSVSEFTDLPNVQQQLLSAMSTVIVQVTTMTPTVIPTILVESQAPRRDVVFLLDGSDGTRSGFPAMRDFVQRVVETLGVDENRDRVAVVQYSKDPAAQFYLNTYTTKGEILNTVRGLRHKGGRPLNTGAALQYVRDNVFTVSSGSRRIEGVPQLLILLSGGRSFDNVDTPASALKELGVLIFGIGTRSSDSRELQRISHDPSYALSVSDFTDLPNIQQQLLSSVEAVVIEVTPESTTDLVDHDTSRKDVVFLVDGSDGTRNGFPAMRDFVQRVVGKLNVGGDKDRVSVVQYGRDQEVHFYLNTYTTKEDILDTVRSLRHRGGRPLNTGAALQYVRDNVFTASSGSRSQEGVPQMLILLSGGRSSDNVDIPASALKESGVLIFGIGTRNSSREVQRIATDPSFSQSVSEFSDLPSVQEQFFSSLITVQVEATPITPRVIVDQSIARKDVVFLLDGSDGTRNGFPAMRDFVQRVVEKLTVEENRDRVSVVQYSRESEAHFYLNTYTTKEDVVDTVRGLRHKGGRPLNTGAALQYVRDNVFIASSGSRRLEGVPQILILLNGGRSFDNVDTPASALKELGVLVFGIGTRSSDSRELQKISYDPQLCSFRV